MTLGGLFSSLDGNWASLLLTHPLLQLEAQLHHLSSTHQEASLENQQLREAERDLAGQLKEVRGQLQVTREHIHTARGHVSWQMEEEPRQVAAIPGTETRGFLEEGREALSSLRLWTAPRTISLLKPCNNPASLGLSCSFLRQGN